jgi:transposase/heme-degrading monooxygenase HmoA
MIIRDFAARLKPGKRGDYERLCRASALPLMREQPGFLSGRIAHVLEERPDDFVLVSLWTDLESIRAFVGERWQEAIILPGEADLLHEVSVRHFDESYGSLVAMWRAMADVVKRRELTAAATPLSDAQWERVKPLLPPPHKEGRPRADDRRTLEGILFVLRAGCRWHDLPAAYGSAVTCWRRFQQWERDGTWERIWHELIATLDPPGRQAWALSFLDSRFVPARAAKEFVPTTRRRKRSGT